MKKISIKKISVSLFLLTILAFSGCGKNKANSGTAATNYGSYPVAQNQSNQQLVNELVSKVDQDLFFKPQGDVSAIKQLMVQADCTGGFFKFCTYGSGNSQTMIYRVQAQTISNSSYGANVTAVHTQLKSLVRTASFVQVVGAGVYYMRTANNEHYHFNFNYPLVMNPVQKRLTDGSGFTIY